MTIINKCRNLSIRNTPIIIKLLPNKPKNDVTTENDVQLDDIC